MFNPFFYTKPTEKGTGYMSKKVVAYLHGRMRIDPVEEGIYRSDDFASAIGGTGHFII